MHKQKRKINFLLVFLTTIAFSSISFSQNPNENYNKFKQLHEEEQTPNAYRTAAGAPGYQYYQQQADYKIEVELREDVNEIHGEETITYYNNSPDALTYLWVQLDQNVRAQDADSKTAKPTGVNPQNPLGSLQYNQRQAEYDFDGGFNLESVTSSSGAPLPYIINKTMMRIDLAEPLLKGQTFVFNISWWYNINDRMAIGGRSGYEHFEEDGNNLYTIAQFYPRMALYSHNEGWQNKQFLGNGEFALTFGDFDVKITVPADHILGATGELQNEKDVLCKTMRGNLKKARNTFDEPVIIFGEEDAIENEKDNTSATKTWHYKAEMVRDFAFATSRKFIWDAMAVKLSNGETTMAMSLYPKEGNPLWEDYSTRAVAHTIKEYSKYSFDYPYPVAYSVHAAAIGMEYPMICFNFGRPDAEGNYSDRTKYGMLGVIIHEVGHNYFPMIVNSDERQWGWMDEGINSFIEYLAERTFDDEFQHWFGPASTIIPYMKGDKQYLTPIMSDADNLRDWNLGNNAYGKPAAALNVLRDHVMGPELFDYAFKTYCERWKFKHPTPEDFFNTMEDASGVDLDWFWRGWFYTTDHVDVKINSARAIELADADRQEVLDGRYAYQVDFENIGGLPTPLLLTFNYTDGSSEDRKIPAEIWKSRDKVNKVFLVAKEVQSIVFDKDNVTTDIDTTNNMWTKTN